MPVDLTCRECGAAFRVQPCRARKAKYCSYHCHQVGEGRKGGRVRGEQKKAESCGKAYTKTNGRHTHRIVAEKKLGRALASSEVVHHVDGNKLNNDPENIEVLPGQADHVRIHIQEMLAKRKQVHGY